MPQFKVGENVLISRLTNYKGLKGKEVMVSDVEQRADGYHYLVSVKLKQYWIPEVQLL